MRCFLIKILIVEDDKILSDTIKECIDKNYNVEQATDGYDGYMLAKGGIYDLIILDLMLPEISGFEILSKLRKNKINTPVLILTAKDSLQDKVKGLTYGADDYLVKPFEREELLARIEAILRRSIGDYTENELRFLDLTLNLNNRKATINGKEINLQGKQFDILEYLINCNNTIVTKEQIFDKIWGFDSSTTTNVVEVYASGLRKELNKYGYGKYIKTIRGVGYILSE